MSSRLLQLLYRFVPKRYYLGAVELLQSGDLLLDVGSGNGLLIEEIENRFEYLVGLDVDIALLKKLRKSSRVDVVLASGCYLPFRNCSFDNIVFHDSLHHLESPEIGIMEACRALKRGGRLFVFDFNLERVTVKALAFLEKLIGFPAKFLGRRTLISLLKNCLRIIEEKENWFGTLKILGVKPYCSAKAT